MPVIYKSDIIPSAEQVIELYNNAGLTGHTEDVERIRKMYQNAKLIIIAWSSELLVGVSRSITD